MNALAIIENAVNYIEKNLETSLTVSEIAHQSGYSEFYFQRLFSVICNISVGEYIRCRRMTLAADDLLNSSLRIIDIAYKYGYETPESFTKAFHRFHGISPSKLRQQAASAKKFSRIYPAVHTKDKLDLSIELKKLPAFRFTGLSAEFPLTESIFRDDIPAFWDQCHDNDSIHSFFQYAESSQPFQGIAACCMEAETNTSMNYMIGTCNNQMNMDTFIEIPELNWLTFKGTGKLPEVIQLAWHQIYTDYFPSSPYHPYGRFELEIYPTYDMNTPFYAFEIWVPIKESENV